jgi:hypothetical protein
MSNGYIEVPIETEPDELAADGFDFIQSKFPNWVPNDGNLDTVVVEATAFMTAEARDVASAVPNDIFRAFGKLVDILPDEATFATATTAWTVINNAGYTIPAGTQVGIVIAGDETIAFETVDAIVFPGGGATTLTGQLIQAVNAGEEASGLPDTSAVLLLDTLDYVTSVDLEVTTSGGHDAEDDDTYLGRLSQRLQVMTQVPVLAEHFAIFAQDIESVERATAIDGYNPDHNRLTINQSSFETDTTGWVAITNCTIAKDGAQFLHGVASLRMRSAAGGNMSSGNTPTNQYACGGGSQITAFASFRAAASARSCRVNLSWYDSGNAFISTTNGTSVADTTSGWTLASITAVAPANAAFVRIVTEVLATGAALEDHYVDKLSLKDTPSLNWNIGGTPATNNERYVTVAGVDDEGQQLSGAKDIEIDTYLESLREVNFVVEVIDPVYTPIDVTFTAISKPDFDPAVVEAAAEQAVTDFLSPKNWGLPDVTDVSNFGGARGMWINKTVVRYLELSAVLDNVEGLDYVTSLQLRIAGGTLASANVTLGNVIPLPTSGTISGTVTAP